MNLSTKLNMQEEFENRMLDNKTLTRNFLKLGRPEEVSAYEGFVNGNVFSFYRDYNGEPGFEGLYKELRETATQQVTQVLQKFKITPARELIWRPGLK